MHGRKTKPPTSQPPPVAPLPDYVTVHADGVTLAIKLQPRASKNEISTANGPELRIKVTAPPVDSAANEALIRLLADFFNVSRSKVELVRGHTSRNKVIRIVGISDVEIRTRLTT